MVLETFRPLAVAVLLCSLPLVSSAKQKAPKNSDVDNIGTRDINKGNILPTMSIDKEVALGQELAAQVARQLEFIRFPELTEYVNRLGQNLARNSDVKVPLTINVVDSDEINAFALPGGFLYVNVGVILAADEEAELAGVMAHEIGHIAARHGAEAASKQNAVGIASIPLIILGGPAGVGIREAAQIGIPLAFLKFTRKQEGEADYLGTQYMYKAGYDPGAVISFFEKLEAKEKSRPGTMSTLFSDHPPTPDRVAAVKNEIETILPPREQYMVTTSEFDRVKADFIASKQKPQDAQRPAARRSSSRPRSSDPEASQRGREPEPAETRTPPEDSGDQPPVLKRKN